jgi:hypothetical protein
LPNQQTTLPQRPKLFKIISNPKNLFQSPAKSKFVMQSTMVRLHKKLADYKALARIFFA